MHLCDWCMKPLGVSIDHELSPSAPHFSAAVIHELYSKPRAGLLKNEKLMENRWERFAPNALKSINPLTKSFWRESVHDLGSTIRESKAIKLWERAQSFRDARHNVMLDTAIHPDIF